MNSSRFMKLLKKYFSDWLPKHLAIKLLLLTQENSKNKLLVHMYIVKNTTIFLIVRLLLPVAYPGIFFGVGGWFQQIQLRTERTGIWGW